MKFVDEAIITVSSGDGGRGCVSFRREKFIERGGPDGGDGGNGGDVVFKASPRKRTLYQFKNQKIFNAPKGGHGQGKQRYGKSAKNLILEIPPGTIISDADTGDIIYDFIQPDEETVVAKGGRGGRGNKHFTSSTHRAPRFAQPGEPGETQKLKLELKLLADVGIIGFPNAGKSTLISVISSARPKIADYPFTTLTPNIGMVQAGWGEPFAVADIPGLIEGAHSGTGLGIKFLRHVERTRILVHLIDVTSIDLENPLQRYRAINKELVLYSEKLSEKRQVVVLTKMDLTDAGVLAETFISAFGNNTVELISAATGKGVEDLKNRLARMLDRDYEE